MKAIDEMISAARARLEVAMQQPVYRAPDRSRSVGNQRVYEPIAKGMHMQIWLYNFEQWSKTD
jgi:hypothetical protein